MVGPLVRWGTAVTWAVCCWYAISVVDRKLSVLDLTLMMPQWCVMTDYVSSGLYYIVLSPTCSIAYCFATLVGLITCWFMTLEADVDKLTAETLISKEDIDAMISKEVIEEVLLENAKCLMDQVDLEYKHCAASIAANNETPGQKVGGEAEWATGETSSDEEDATREITGAHVRKSPRDTDDGRIMTFLQAPFEPNIKMHQLENNL